MVAYLVVQTVAMWESNWVALKVDNLASMKVDK